MESRLAGPGPEAPDAPAGNRAAAVPYRGYELRDLTLVPLELYFNRGRAKVALALAKGKKSHDRREDIKRRIADREMSRALKSHR